MNYFTDTHTESRHQALYQRVRAVLDYDPSTGIFTWKVPKSNFVNKGDRAGHLHASGYRLIKIDGRIYRARHLAWLWVYGYLPRRVFSINRIRDDDRLENLFI